MTMRRCKMTTKRHKISEKIRATECKQMQNGEMSTKTQNNDQQNCTDAKS